MSIGLVTPGANATDVQTALDLKATTASVALKANIASPTFTGVPIIPVYTLGTLPAVGVIGGIIVVSDADTGAGALCFSDGSNWIDAKTHATVA